MSDDPVTEQSTRGGDEPEAVRYTVLSPAAIWTAAVVIVLVGAGVAVWLLFAFGGGDAQQRNQLEAIKTAGTIVVGTGGAAALLLAARRQRTAEIALKQKDRDARHQEQVARSNEHDATERRVTELYTTAVEQLGSDKAPVRLGGLYALERVAQDHPEHRQTIVNVLCAYLRMPYQPPGEPPAADADPALREARREQVQERVGASSIEQLWITDSYGFMVAGFVITMGRRAIGLAAVACC